MTNKADVTDYINGVLSGELVTGKLVKAAVRRHLEDLENCEDRGLYFDEYYANRVIDFFRVLQHTTGEFAGDPFEPRLWQKFILWVLFGWRRKSDDSRRFRWAYISVGRGNGKSPTCAAIANYLFLADEPPEPRSQIYAFATKEAQARDIVFEEAKKQIEAVPAFGFVERLRNNMNITQSPWNGSKFEPKGSDSKKSDGWILHGGVIDELHEWHDNQRKLFEKIETSMAKRRQPLCLIITTAGDDDSDIWQEQYDFYRQVVERGNGFESDDHFAYIAEVDESEPCPKCSGPGCQYCDMTGTVPVDPLVEKYWPQANPMLCEPNSPVKIAELRSLANKATVMPTAKNTFRRYYANQRVASFYKLIPAELWANGNRALPELEGLTCHGGFDWGWKDDLASLSLVFSLEDGVYVKNWAWIPEGCKRDLTREPFASWISNGYLIVTDGDTTDINAIYQTMGEVLKAYDLKTLAADPNNCREFLTKCVNEWDIETFEFYQSCKKYNEPTKKLVDLLRVKKFFHGNNPLLGWCAGNVTVKEDSAGYVMPCKLKSQDKIDPIVATIMGLSEILFADEHQWTEDELGL